jgi:hypothetical protein
VDIGVHSLSTQLTLNLKGYITFPQAWAYKAREQLLAPNIVTETTAMDVFSWAVTVLAVLDVSPSVDELG